MCGIAGLVSGRLDKERLTAAADAMSAALFHRGPDSGGIWISPDSNVAFVHRRLAIHDLSPAGHQPMFSESGRWGIVFNGEIYNYQMLKQDLVSVGVSFRGDSDTEVLLAAIERWGVVNALARADGMFALCAYDLQLRSMVLARDRMGEKPLYYGYVNGSFVWASELAAIENAKLGTLEIDHVALANYFKFGYVPAPRSIYSGIRKLPPGSILQADVVDILAQQSEKFSFNQYWSVDEIARQEKVDLNPSQAIAELDLILNKTIELHKLSDVPLGAFISGGIDSTTVAAILQSQSASKINTFTIGFKDPAFDEAPLVRPIVGRLGTNHNEFYIGESDLLKVVPQLGRTFSEPFADSSQIPMLVVSRMARQHVTVCLSGDGGDELFCGYNRYFWLNNIWQKTSRISPALRRVLGGLIGAMPAYSIERLFESLVGYGVPGVAKQANLAKKIEKLAVVLSSRDMQSAYDYLLSFWTENLTSELAMKVQFDASETMTPLQKMMLLDQKSYLPDDNLVKGDRASMAVALETRLPLLGRDVIEFSWKIPDNLKFRNGQSKWILRQVLYKYVPREMVERPKMGFSVPVGRWLRKELNDWAESLFSNCHRLAPELNCDRIARVWNEHKSARRDYGHEMWAVLTYLQWKAERN